jgi:DNA-binding NarL/FixJ family response regulator
VRRALPSPAFRIVAECTDGRAALSAVRAHVADVLVLDLNMPDTSGITVLQRLRAERARVRVLVLSGEDERTGGLRALRAGADGYAPKSISMADLSLAIGLVARGKHFFRAAVTMLLAPGPQDDDALLGSLSEREFEVLKGLARGRTNGEIGADLALDPKTVSSCRNRLMRKLGLPNLPALVEFARLNNIDSD